MAGGHAFGGLLLVAAAAYPIGILAARRRDRSWPGGRTACWYAGLTAAAASIVGPAAGHGFVAHMGGHLLLGMVAPLLLVLAAPGTLALRALPVGPARRLSRLLATPAVRFLTHPVTAAVLLANAVAGVDPMAHRPGRPVRAVALLGFLAAHAILAKYLYGHPPAGVPAAAGRTGAELMYYGGDLVDVALVTIFCWQWYDPARFRVGARRSPQPWRLPGVQRSTVDRHRAVSAQKVPR